MTITPSVSPTEDRVDSMRHVAVTGRARGARETDGIRDWSPRFLLLNRLTKPRVRLEVISERAIRRRRTVVCDAGRDDGPPGGRAQC